ncbi:unnamed protein product [Cylicocyclus nassatus]|uniref:glucuronosyltransferase n=1 Tax=Cylicocyclus nassatus TaxID=53992 RepID=A0AA36MAT0_CYLNA|nr:unnamed protein product [Cylicocyclus nassatus]
MKKTKEIKKEMMFSSNAIILRSSGDAAVQSQGFVAHWRIASYKMALFVPGMSNSQVLYNARVAETLAKAGHDVTMIMIRSMDDLENNVKIMKEVKIHSVNASYGMSWKELEERHSKVIFEDMPMWDSRMVENFKLMTKVLLESCRRLVENKEFIRWLAAEEFDLAFTHMYDVCPIGLIHYVKIPSWIWLNSGALMDFIAHNMGVPLIPSYVPPFLQESSDHMSFIERAKSFIGHTIMPVFWKMFADKETAIFRNSIDPEFPDIVDIARKCPLVMVNSNELYDLPRPMLAKIVNIGGLGMELKDAKPFEPEFQKIVDVAEGVVVFSFGSIASAHKMPISWKLAFIEAFKRFPKKHVIWRYEGADLQDKLPPNVHLFKWIPQADLLQNSKTEAFLTHGGYNSVQEAISAGVPMITIALFGDQPKNAKLAERQQFSINIPKSKVNADAIAGALQKIFTDTSYSQRIKRFSQMVRKKPVSPSHLLISWSEFTAEFKTLENLVPAGNKLNFFQYHSLDVIAFLLSIILFIAFVLFTIAKVLLRKLWSTLRTSKLKNE